MRISFIGSLLIVAAGFMGGCGSSGGAKPETPTATPAPAGNTAVMKSGGSDVLQLTLVPNAKFVAKDGSLHINAPQIEVEVWLVNGAKTVDDAVADVPQQIVSEFKDFKPTSTTDLTIAGSPAKRLIGLGHEADDGDPGQADVIVFKVGDHVFVACTHGEALMSVAKGGMLTMVQSARTVQPLY